MNIIARSNYERGVRYLRGAFNGIHFQLYWQGRGVEPKSLAVFHWFDRHRTDGDAPQGTTRYFRVAVDVLNQQVNTSYRLYSRWRHHPITWASAPYPESGDWREFLQVARFVAAKKAPAITLLGWIEDNAPSPWSLLASPTPIECFRALSPVPLSE